LLKSGNYKRGNIRIT